MKKWLKKIAARRTLQQRTDADRARIASYLAGHPVRRLQIGSGKNVRAGWLNTNYEKSYLTEQENLIWLDATQPFPFGAEAFDIVFSEHMIEHVSYPMGRKMVQECFRVMKPGGTIRISTPDLHFLLALFEREKTDVQSRFMDFHIAKWMPDLVGDTAIKETLVLNSFIRRWGHLFIYDRETLARLLESAGFESMRFMKVGESGIPELQNLEAGPSRMDPVFYQLQTIIIEADKPANAA